jgi:hypothetical protein
MFTWIRLWDDNANDLLFEKVPNTSFIWHMKNSTKKEIEPEANMRQDVDGKMGLNMMGRW